MATRMPLFPLGTVLFPGVPLPLHIFEPRYRRLLADVLAGDRRFAIVPPGLVAEAPPAGAIGCIGTVHAAQALPDGRSNIVVVGDARCRIDGYRDEGTPYLLADVVEVDDDEVVPTDPARLALLRTRFLAYVEALRTLHELDEEQLELSEDAGVLTFQVAASLQVPPAIKQQLLEMRSPAVRTAQLLELLPPLIAETERALAVHRRARTNGTGGHHHDVSGFTPH